MSHRFAASILASVGLVAGCWLLAPAVRRLPLVPDTAELIRLCGPFRGLPIPFAWQALNRAKSRYNPTRVVAAGQWLARLMPERKDLFSGFAYDIAYSAGPLENDPRRRASRVAEAVALLELGLRLHPQAADLPARAAFILTHKTETDPDLAQSFRQHYGDPLALAVGYMGQASTLWPTVDWYRWQRANLLQQNALQELRAGDRTSAARMLADAAERFAPIRAERSARLGELAAALSPGGVLTPTLRSWLTSDWLMSRHPELWHRD
ncbi:MAG: hypothetical protein CML07_01475 [Psychrobacter sp.]|jgi:hypothetical protein|nr:hypothetical protein [Psychrobacter sp.]